MSTTTPPSTLSVIPQVHKYINLVILCLSAVVLIAFQQKPEGWILLGLGLLHAVIFGGKQFSRHMGLVYASLAILGYTRISTEISYGHILEMGLALLIAVSLPFVVSTYIFKEKIITFPLNWAVIG